MSVVSVLANVRIWIVLALIFGIIIGDVGDIGPTIIIVALIAMMSISLMGLDLNKQDIVEKKKELALGIICCYVVACVVTLGIGMLFDPVIWNGWVLIASVPCAVSVVSASLILKGDVKLALMSVTVIYVLALGITPLMTKIFIGDAVSPLEILKYVLLFILIPIVLSIPLKKVTLSANARNILINFCFFVLVFLAFGSNRDFILERPALVLAVAAGCLVRIVAVHGAMEFMLKRLGIKRDTRIVLILLSIWKNSALAMTLAMILLPNAESALPGALSLPLEMIWFMVMMWYYSAKCPPESNISLRA